MRPPGRAGFVRAALSATRVFGAVDRTGSAVADSICRCVRIEGRVQGVGFRENCVRQARALGLAGYVRNRRDGSVEVLLQGPADAVSRLEDWLHEGPPLARVDRVTRLSPPSTASMPERFERWPTE